MIFFSFSRFFHFVAIFFIFRDFFIFRRFFTPLSYKLAILGQLNTMSIILEEIPQFVVHLYVLYVISGHAEQESVKSVQSGWTPIGTNYTQINESFDSEGIFIDWKFDFFIHFSFEFAMSARKIVMVKLLLSIKSFCGDFSNYKRTTLELHKSGDDEGETKSSSWQCRNFSKLMMMTAQWTDTITQLMFFSARAMVCIWAVTNMSASGRGLWIDYTLMSIIKTVAFFLIYDVSKSDKFSDLAKSWIGMSTSGYKKYTLVPDYTFGDPERKIDQWLPLLSYFTYNLGSNYMVTILNYSLTILEFGWFHSRCKDYFSDKLDPILLLVVSFFFATQTFLLYKLAVVFDDECGDEVIQQEGLDESDDNEVSEALLSKISNDQSKSIEMKQLKQDIEDALESDESEKIDPVEENKVRVVDLRSVGLKPRSVSFK